MTEAELSSLLDELKGPQELTQLPVGLRTRTIADFDRLRPPHASFSWSRLSKVALAAATFCALTAAAFQLPAWPKRDATILLPDRNRLVVRTVFRPPSLLAWWAIFAFRLDTSAHGGYYQQVLHVRGYSQDFGYRMKAQVSGGGSYDLLFQRTEDAAAGMPLVPEQVHVRLEEQFALKLFRTPWFTCFTVIRPGAPIPECTP